MNSKEQFYNDMEEMFKDVPMPIGPEYTLEQSLKAWWEDFKSKHFDRSSESS